MSNNLTTANWTIEYYAPSSINYFFNENVFFFCKNKPDGRSWARIHNGLGSNWKLPLLHFVEQTDEHYLFCMHTGAFATNKFRICRVFTNNYLAHKMWGKNQQFEVKINLFFLSLTSDASRSILSFNLYSIMRSLLKVIKTVYFDVQISSSCKTHFIHGNAIFYEKKIYKHT